MIDINKKYRTRGGQEVRIYAVDVDNLDNVHGAYLHKDGKWMIASWGWGGARHDAEETPMDLIEVKPRIKRTVWLSIWRNNYIEASNLPEWRNGPLGCGEAPIACIKVEIDCEEGEGL